MATASSRIPAAAQKASTNPASQSGPDTEAGAEGPVSDQDIKFRFKSERAPFRRGGLAFAEARQWVEFTASELKEAVTEEGFRALLDEPVVHVQGSKDGGKTWETLAPPKSEPEDEE